MSTNNEIIAEINKRLQIIFGDNINRFLDIMVKLNIFITGQFLLECILKEKWEKPVIDFYLLKKNTKELKKFLENIGFVWTGMKGTPYFISGQRITISKYEPSIINNDNYTKIRIIALNDIPPNIAEWMDQKFDFDVCKNYFKTQNDLFIKDINQISNKKTLFKFPLETYGIGFIYTIKKYVKYKKYGFLFTNESELFEYITNNTMIVDKENIYHKNYLTFEIIFDKEEKYIGKNGKHKIRYLYDLVKGDISDLKNNLLTTRRNGKITKNPHINLNSENKIVVKPENIQPCEPNSPLHNINYYQYCPYALCSINDKPHFHVTGKNILCCCVKNCLTFVYDKFGE